MERSCRLSPRRCVLRKRAARTVIYSPGRTSSGVFTAAKISGNRRRSGSRQTTDKPMDRIPRLDHCSEPNTQPQGRPLSSHGCASTMIDWLTGLSSSLDLSWRDLLLAALAFLVTSTASLVVVGFVFVKMPAGYFSNSTPMDSVAGGRSGGYWMALIAKNLVGSALILLGGIMALPVVPGPGLLIALTGVMLTDFPAKRRLERWLLSGPGVLTAINRLRHRFGKSPLFLEGGPSTPARKPCH